MSQPRFQIVSMTRWADAHRLRPTARISRDRDRRGLVYGWRLLGANNREIARGIDQYLTVEECEQVVSDLKGLHPDSLYPRVSFDAATHGWSWALRSELGDVAKSARSFHRQRECLGSVAQFKEKFPDAIVLLPKLSRSAERSAQRLTLSVADLPGAFE